MAHGADEDLRTLPSSRKWRLWEEVPLSVVLSPDAAMAHGVPGSAVEEIGTLLFSRGGGCSTNLCSEINLSYL